MTKRNSLVDYPQLFKEWDYQKNMGFNPKVDLFSGRIKLWWICSLGHSWESILTNRIKGSGCPYCSGTKILKGFNDLFTKAPETKEKWDFEKNETLGIKPESLGTGSGIRVWWKCDNFPHSYEASPATLMRGRKCPYCTNKKVLVGFNDLATTHPDLLKEWDYEKNVLSPLEITAGTDKNIYWICNKGHSYSMSGYRRTGKDARGCSICAGKVVIESTSIVVHPEMIKLWDFEKNIVDPKTVSIGSNKKYWWLDDCGHSFQKSPKFIKNGSRCPYCSGTNTKLLKGYNDLATKSPHLVKEWGQKNGVLLPSDFVSGSKKKVWWVCEKGHEWETIIEYRHRNRSSCPKCSMCGTSKQEKELQNFINNLITEEAVLNNSYKIIPPQELDIYVPSKRIAIEFNGLYWHSEASGKKNSYHYDKWKSCKDKNIQLLTIWEDDWLNNRVLIENMLKYKLKLNDTKKIYARNTFVKSISNNEAKLFLNQNHIQGFKTGCSNLALITKDNNTVVSVIQTNTDNESCYVQRYATSCSVVGGFTKLLSYIEKTNSKITQIVTFADNEVSDGGLYENNGFEIDSYLKPDYKYIYKNKRYHKFLFRKKRFKEDSDLLYEEGLTEKELAELNKISRVWDSGKTKYVKKL